MIKRAFPVFGNCQLAAAVFGPRDADVARPFSNDKKCRQQLLKFPGQTNDNVYFADQILAEIDRSLEKDRSYNQYIVKRAYEQMDGTNVYTGPFTSDEIGSQMQIIQQDKTAYKCGPHPCILNGQ